MSAAVGFYYAYHSNYYLFFILYAISQFLDAVDGNLARLLNQGMEKLIPFGYYSLLTIPIIASRFGAILDMFTDRASTVCLLMLLASLYPEYTLILMANAALDICSHFAQLYATFTTGLTSHKDVSETTNVFLRIYYGNKLVLFLLCLGNEASILLFYLLKMVQKEQPEERVIPILYVEMLLYISVPFMLMKQFMHVLQLQSSMSQLSKLDMKERTQKKK